MSRTNSILAVLHDAKNRLHALRNTVPIGIRSIDDATDNKIKDLTEFVNSLETRVNNATHSERKNHA